MKNFIIDKAVASVVKIKPVDLGDVQEAAAKNTADQIIKIRKKSAAAILIHTLPFPKEAKM